MNRDDIIRMVREACDKGKVDAWYNGFWTVTQEELERFAAIVAAAEREAMRRDGWRQCAVGQRTTQFCGMTEDAVKAEREACAKLCEIVWDTRAGLETGTATECAAAIRTRGEK